MKLLLILLLLLTGCTQTIIEKSDGTRLKINTVLMTSGLESLYFDDEFFEVGGYHGITDKLEIRYNPFTGVKLSTE